MYDYITPKPAVYEAVNPDYHKVLMDKNESLMFVNKGHVDQDDYENIDLQPTSRQADFVEMEDNPAYAETHFK